jgi:hypothetical protein
MLGHFISSVTTNTLGYWPMTANATTDLSGNSFTLTNNAGVTYSATLGKFGGCGVFANNGTAGFAGTIPAMTTTKTFSVWVYQTSLTGSGTNYEYLWSETYYSSATVYTYRGIALNNGVLTYVDNTYGTSYVTASTYTNSLNAWTHLLVTVSGTSIRFYVNGVFHDAQTASGSTSNATPGFIEVGSLYGSVAPGDYGGSIVGNLCEVIVENTVWSAIQIQKYYTWCRGRFGII